MTSSSTSSNQKIFKYDVFLSFRGEDTRKNFVDHLYFALQQKSIHTYKDDERIVKGKRIGDEVIKSIEESKLYIIVFSKNYASSSWCLDELVKIMECQKMIEHTAYPVFYDVEPTEVRKQSGSVGDSFAKHERVEAAGKWREALNEAADLAGWELKNIAEGHEAKLIQKIVEEISLELFSLNSNVDGKLVGMEARVEDIVSSLETSLDDVRMIGIKGIGGGGKTTLAQTVFDQISIMFEGKSFVENVREVSKASLSGLRLLQKQVLSDVLNDQGVNVRSVYDGKNMMKKMMRGRKVLVVLDDVDHIDQLEALAGGTKWFKPGSRIIITTRDEQVLVAHGVNLIHDVNLLSHEEAICLFSRYAFGIETPLQGYEELSEKVVHYAAGLPLTIRVLGSFLRGKDELDWHDALERLKKIPLLETMKMLEISYESLENDYREIFLDVACILKGWKKDKAMRVLESCGFHARNGLRVLEQKSLITISDSGYLGMHDHIEEMGKNIVRRLHLDEPNKHSRLWIDEEINDILARDLGTDATRCVKLSTTYHSLETVIRGLGNMKKLRVLHIDCGIYQNFDIDNQHFPDSLRYLSWSLYPFESLSETFQADYLVGLELWVHKFIQLWKGRERKVLNKLRFLDLGYSDLITFDLGMTPNIKILNFNCCEALTELRIHDKCPKLKALSLNNSNLTNLNLGLTPELETLSLEECWYLVELHIPFGCPKLKSFSLKNSRLRKLTLGPTPNLKTLRLVGCHDLDELQIPFGCQNLRSLDLHRSKLRTLDLELTPNLESLDLKDSFYLVEILAPVGCLKKVVSLDLSGCGKFKSFLFEKQFQSVEVGSSSELHLIAESTDICPLHSDNNFPKLRFDCFYKEHQASLFGNLEKLISAGLCACNLERFSVSICSLQFLRKLTLEGSFPELPQDLDKLECLKDLILLNTEIKNFPHRFSKLKHLKSLKLKSCWHLDKLPEDFGQLESLEELVLSSSNIKSLPDSICMFKYLKSLKLKSCWHLAKLLEGIDRLECLEELILSSKKTKHLPDNICRLKHLKSLQLKTFWLIEKLPEELGRLECLEKLILTECMFLRDIPNSICEMKHLKYFHLPYCILVQKLPEEIGHLECLKELNIKGTGITHLPQSIFLLKGLCIIGSRWHLDFWCFTSELQTSEYETLCYI